MIVMIWDSIVWILLTCAIVAGCYTMHRHEEFFEQFTIIELMHGSVEGVLYLINSVSTAGCLIDLVLCMVWAFDIGWTNSGQQWQILWLIWHGFTAGVFFCVHVAINVVIQELIRLRGNEQARRLANGGRYRFFSGNRDKSNRPS